MIKFYKNGISLGIPYVNSYNYPINKNLALEIGRDGHYSYKYMNGQLDDIRIYNRGLTVAEVVQLYKFEDAILKPNVPTTSTFTTTDGNLCRNENSQSPTLQISIYPNPSGNVFNVKVKAPKEKSIMLRVFDVNGRTAYTTKGMPGQIFHFGEQLRLGTYLVEVKQGNEVNTIKVVKIK